MKLLKLHERDNVGVAIRALRKGSRIKVEDSVIKVCQDIPAGHKIALVALPTGSSVRKYGHIIGHTARPVPAGAWLHGHNLKTNLGKTERYTYRHVPATRHGKPPYASFRGYRRADGKVGTRNEIWIISTVGCIDGFVEELALQANRRFRHGNCDGIYAITHPYGCSQLGTDLEHTRSILAGLAQHPNAGGVLLVGLGCENNQLDDQLAVIRNRRSRRLRFFNLQESRDEMAAGLKAVDGLLRIARKDRRAECPVSDLVVGMKCGGSDAFSGITANPLAGRIADLVTARNGTVLLSEVPEMFGAEQQLMNRAVSRKVFRQIVSMVNDFKSYFVSHGQPVYENPSPGNKAGGITTLEEKSLGAVQKGGTATITQVLGYGERASRKGLVLVSAPGNDGVSSTAMAAAGATLLLFTTGRGTPMGFPVPTIKVSSNSELCRRKPGWIDFDAGRILAATSRERMTQALFDLVLDTASGRTRTKSEINGYRQIAIWKDGVTL
jgi:altronate hydrolase